MENTNITDNTRQAGHSADSTINAGTDIKSSTTNTSQHTIDDINSGQQPLEAESTLRLSDMYEKNVDNPELELTVRVININTDNYAGNKARTINSKYSNGSGRNSKDNNNFNRTNMYTYSSEFLSKCETLKDYMTFVNKVRFKMGVEGDNVRIAVTEAMNECIDEDILVDFFEQHREEVVEVSIYDYDEEEVRRVLAEEYAQEVAQGMAQEIVEKAAKEASEKAFAEGEQSMMINQIIKKVKKSKTLETIASELEEEVADIKPIYDVVIAAAPDYNIDIIKNKLAIN